jgi:hypothetical protein
MASGWTANPLLAADRRSLGYPNSMPSDFAALARDERPGLARLLLSAAGEFRDVDGDGARVELDRMAARLYLWTEREGLSAAAAVERLLVEHRLRPSSQVGPEDALLDAVLARRTGHPALIAAACIEAANRAGLPAGALGGGGSTLMVGIREPAPPGEEEAVAIVDPAGGPEPVASQLGWRCSHEIAFVVLSELSRLYCLTGDVPRALRAAQLRAELPIGRNLRARLAFEAGALQAMLN